jgi:integrase
VRGGNRYWQLGEIKAKASGVPAYAALGPDGEEAQRKALSLYAAYRRAKIAADKEDADRLAGWPKGSLGAFFHLYQKTEDWTVDKKPRTRQEWLDSWKVIGERFGRTLISDITVSASEKFHRDCRKPSVLPDGTKTDGLDLTETEAWRVLKIWRAMLNVLAAKHIIDRAPIGTVPNPMPDSRAEFWIETEVARLLRASTLLARTCRSRADRNRFTVMGLVLRLAWETAMSAVDCRTFSLAMIRQDAKGVWRIERTRSKSGAKAKPPLSEQLVRDLQAYGATLPVLPLTGQPLFRTTDGTAWSRTYLSHAFDDLRRVTFGKHEKRQLQDLRRSANLEAELGGATAEQRAALLANRLDKSRRLDGTYTPVTTMHAQKAQDARVVGREIIAQELGRKRK